MPGQAELENSERTARNADQASTCRVSLQNTRVYACGMHGICVHGGANSVAVTDCIVADHAQCCIEVEAGASVMVNSSKLAGEVYYTLCVRVCMSLLFVAL